MWRRRLASAFVTGIRSTLQGAEGTLTSTGGCRTPALSSPIWSQTRRQWGRPPREEERFGHVTVFVPSIGRKDGYQRFSRRGASFSRRQFQVLAVAGAGGVVIWASSRQEIPYSGRKHAILISTATERALGEQTFRQILSEAQATGRLLPASHPASLAVRRVGSRIASVAGDGVGGGYQDQMKGLKWEFAVIRSPEMNAFVVPGGKVVVYTGLLRLISREDELAAVLAHEVAHVLARHAAERMTQGSVMELVRLIAYWGFGLPIPQGPLVAMLFLPNSRKAETEADVIGVQLAARACYDPAAAASVFSKLGEVEARHGGDSVPKFLRTHPVSSDRIASIKKMLPRATVLGEAAGCEGPRTRLQEFEDRLGRQLRPVEWGVVRASVDRGSVF